MSLSPRNKTVVNPGQVWRRSYNGRLLRVRVERVLEPSMGDRASAHLSLLHRDGYMRWVWADSLPRLYALESDG